MLRIAQVTSGIRLLQYIMTTPVVLSIKFILVIITAIIVHQDKIQMEMELEIALTALQE